MSTPDGREQVDQARTCEDVTSSVSLALVQTQWSRPAGSAWLSCWPKSAIANEAAVRRLGSLAIRPQDRVHARHVRPDKTAKVGPVGAHPLSRGTIRTLAGSVLGMRLEYRPVYGNFRSQNPPQVIEVLVAELGELGRGVLDAPRARARLRHQRRGRDRFERPGLRPPWALTWSRGLCRPWEEFFRPRYAGGE
jgi:hypothetical protein